MDKAAAACSVPPHRLKPVLILHRQLIRAGADKTLAAKDGTSLISPVLRVKLQSTTA